MGLHEDLFEIWDLRFFIGSLERNQAGSIAGSGFQMVKCQISNLKFQMSNCF
jgi:hypothetical protein